MINVITEHGSSFKGLAAYLYHDVDRADSSERVAWTETHNLATDDPEIAWRIMAATAMQQSDLKREAGIANTGRKSSAHVMHYVLSWHTEEHGQVSKEEMLDAALSSMTYMGTQAGERLGKGKQAKRTQYASEHQAVIVCHDEGPGHAPHLHIMMNRVHPEHGVMLPDSKDYEKLSAWALEYRQAQGKEHYCEQRVKNAAQRAQGYLTSDRRKPRNVYEQQKQEQEADPASRTKAQLEEQRHRMQGLKARQDAVRTQQAAAMARLEDGHIRSEKAERAKTAEAIRSARSKVMCDYAPKISALVHRQADELAAFKEASATVAGRVRNTWAALKTREWLTEIRTEKLHAVSGAFKLAFSSGLQRQQLEALHASEQRDLAGQRTRAKQAATAKLRSHEHGQLDELRSTYLQERSDLLLAQGMDKAKLRAQWKQLRQDRLATMVEDERARKVQAAAERSPESPATDIALTQQAQDALNDHRSGDDHLAEEARKANDFEERMRKRAANRRHAHRDRDDRDRGR